jgi:hypothetical protein
MSREDLCQKYRTKNVKLAINRAIRAELNGGDVLDNSLQFPEKVRELQDAIRLRYGMYVGKHQ